MIRWHQRALSFSFAILPSHRLRQSSNPAKPTTPQKLSQKNTNIKWVDEKMKTRVATYLPLPRLQIMRWVVFKVSLSLANRFSSEQCTECFAISMSKFIHKSHDQVFNLMCLGSQHLKQRGRVLHLWRGSGYDWVNSITPLLRKDRSLKQTNPRAQA